MALHRRRDADHGFQPLLTSSRRGFSPLPGATICWRCRFVLGFYWLLYLGTAAMLGWIAAEAEAAPERRLTRLWQPRCCIWAPAIFPASLQRTGDGPALFLLAAGWRFSPIGPGESWRGLALFGGVLGLAVLARIDASFIVLTACLWELRSAPRAWPAEALARAWIIGGAAVAVSLPCGSTTDGLRLDQCPSAARQTQAWALDGFASAGFSGPFHGGIPLALRGDGEGSLPQSHPAAPLRWRALAALARLSPIAQCHPATTPSRWLWRWCYWGSGTGSPPMPFGSIPDIWHRRRFRFAVGLGLSLAELIHRRPRLGMAAMPFAITPVVVLAGLVGSVSASTAI